MVVYDSSGIGARVIQEDQGSTVTRDEIVMQLTALHETITQGIEDAATQYSNRDLSTRELMTLRSTDGVLIYAPLFLARAQILIALLDATDDSKINVNERKHVGMLYYSNDRVYRYSEDRVPLRCHRCEEYIHPDDLFTYDSYLRRLLHSDCVAARVAMEERSGK
jgi:hypothetical protein